MKASIVIVLGLLATLTTIVAWGSGALVTLSLFLILLKFVGVTMLAGVSYWLPLQLLGTCLVSAAIAGASGIGIAVFSS